MANLDDVRALGRQAYVDGKDWVSSPYPAWSEEDMAWLAGLDDASGHFDIDPPKKRQPTRALASQEEQLDLFG